MPLWVEREQELVAGRVDEWVVANDVTGDGAQRAHHLVPMSEAARDGSGRRVAAPVVLAGVVTAVAQCVEQPQQGAVDAAAARDRGSQGIKCGQRFLGDLVYEALGAWCRAAHAAHGFLPSGIRRSSAAPD